MLICIFGVGLSGQTSSEPSQMDLLDDARPLEIGDRFTYLISEEREPEITVFVNGRGKIKLPLIGEVDAYGKTERDLAFAIREELEETFFYRATVVLDRITDARFDGKVFLVGAVRSQGPQPLPADDVLRLSEMILRAGGFDSNADPSNVTLIRRDGDSDAELRTVYDVKAMLETGDFADDPTLVPNDLILVGKEDSIGQTVYVLGAVNAPGEYPLPEEDITLSQAILSSGGFARFARTNRVKLIRTQEDGSSETTTIDTDAIFERGDRSNDPILEGGDVIRVDERLINF
ncbi:MAG: SLBB domain-containing protein [Verrucomicrobiota bacterium]